MSLRCKIFGHKWSYYKEDVSHVIIKKLNSLPMNYIPSLTFNVDTQFRICKRCYYKQVREHYHSTNTPYNLVLARLRIMRTGRETDWSKCDLSAEELRDKKLKELGI